MKHLYSIKTSLKFLFSRKPSLYCHISFRKFCIFIIVSVFTSVFTFNFMNSFSKIINKIEIAINLALPISCNLQNLDFVIPSPFLSIFVTSFSIGTEKVMYFSIFSIFSNIFYKSIVFQIFPLTLL